MADFSALKTSIQNYIKQNGNEEITGNLLQQILLSMVSTLGDSAINDLVTALNAEIANRGNADTTLQGNINSEATTRANADTELGGRITTLQGVVNGIVGNVENGYVYAGIATPSTTPVSGKVFYLALTAGTYTNFGSIVVPQGINILKYNGSAWSLDSFLGLDDAPTQGSNNLVKSGGVLDSIIKDGSAFDLSAYNNGATYADLSAALTALNALPAVYKKGGMSVKYVQTYDNKYVQYRLMADTFSTTESDWQGVDNVPTAGSQNLVKSGGVFDCLNDKVNASDTAMPTELNTFEYLNNVPLQHINKGDKLIARFKPLTTLQTSGTILQFMIRFFYSASDNDNYVIDNQENYYLGQEYYFEFDVVRDCAEGFPQVNIGCPNFGGTFELELYKYISIKDELNFASVSDFTNRTEEGDSKIPTVGVILNGSDNEPIVGSNNLVKSGGVFELTNKKVNATDYVLPTELDTFEYLNNVPLQYIKKGDKLIARFKPLTQVNDGTSLMFLVRFFYSQSDNDNWVIPEAPYTLNKEIYFEFDVVRDCAEGFPQVNIGCPNFGGTFELELYKYVSLKEEIEKKQDALVSGQNIKTINGLSLLGSGNINIGGGSFSGKKILWLGTSIPQGSLSDEVSINGYTGHNNYPEMVGHLLGCTVYNEAVGGSRIAASRTPEEYNAETNPIALSDGVETMFPFYSSLCATIEEKDYLYDNWASLYQRFTDGVATPPVTKAQMEAFSFEKKVIDKYISDNPSVSKVDVIFLDHGFNDRDNTLFDTTPTPYSDTERFYFKGAMAYLIRKIFEANSRAHIIIGSVYNDMGDPTLKVPTAQKEVAKTFSIPFIDYEQLMTIWNGQFVYTRGYWDADGIWHETGFTWQEDSSEKGYTTNDHGFCSSRPKSEWINTFNVHQVTASEDLSNIYPVGTTVYKSPRLAMMVKDNVHPHSDESGYLNMQIAQYIAKQLEEIVGF